METIKKIFPFSFKYADTTRHFVICLILHFVAGMVASPILGLITFLVGLTGIGLLLTPVFILIGSLIGTYLTIGSILLILAFCKVFKDK